MRLYALDIETDTSPGRNRCALDLPAGLDPCCSAVISVAVRDTAARRSEYFSIDDLGSEVAVLTALDQFLRDAPEGVVVTWNGANFDLPYLATRYERCGYGSALRIAPTDDRPPKYEPLPSRNPLGYIAAWGQHRHIDVAFAYAEFAAAHDVKWSLKPVALAAGIDMVTVDASAVDSLSPAELRDYNVSDVIGTAALAARLDAATFARWLDPRVPATSRPRPEIVRVPASR